MKHVSSNLPWCLQSYLDYKLNTYKFKNDLTHKLILLKHREDIRKIPCKSVFFHFLKKKKQATCFSFCFILLISWLLYVQMRHSVSYGPMNSVCPSKISTKFYTGVFYRVVKKTLFQSMFELSSDMTWHGNLHKTYIWKNSQPAKIVYTMFISGISIHYVWIFILMNFEGFLQKTSLRT